MASLVRDNKIRIGVTCDADITPIEIKINLVLFSYAGYFPSKLFVFYGCVEYNAKKSAGM